MRDCEALGDGYTVGSKQAPRYLHLTSLRHLRVVASPGCCVLAFLCFPGPGQLNVAIFPLIYQCGLMGRGCAGHVDTGCPACSRHYGHLARSKASSEISAVLANDPLDPMS